MRTSSAHLVNPPTSSKEELPDLLVRKLMRAQGELLQAIAEAAANSDAGNVLRLAATLNGVRQDLASQATFSPSHKTSSAARAGLAGPYLELKTIG